MTISHMPSDEHLSEPGFINAIRRTGVTPVLVNADDVLNSAYIAESPGVALIDVGAMVPTEMAECLRQCAQLELPVIALVQRDQLANLGAISRIHDFVITPPNTEELLIRIRRVLNKNKVAHNTDVVQVGDLAINTANYEVAIGGRKISLRFKEYQLLLLMATTPGRVFTRETLLNQIWGYHYMGGTRTVDVHIRRLRSKIEDADHSFIETVWQVGYRFKNQVSY